jgi:hypothetical protein
MNLPTNSSGFTCTPVSCTRTRGLTSWPDPFFEDVYSGVYTRILHEYIIYSCTLRNTKLSAKCLEHGDTSCNSTQLYSCSTAACVYSSTHSCISKFSTIAHTEIAKYRCIRCIVASLISHNIRILHTNCFRTHSKPHLLQLQLQSRRSPTGLRFNSQHIP